MRSCGRANTLSPAARNIKAFAFLPPQPYAIGIK
jgi:hypothetical protein